MKDSIKKVIKGIVPNSVWSKARMILNGGLTMNWTDRQREMYVAKDYRIKTGRELDFNNLQLYSEKMQWYKLYYYHPDLSRIVCKYQFKGYLAEKLGPGYTIPLIGAWKNVNDIPWDSLPKTFVLKSNCQSDGNNILFIKNKDEYSFTALKKKLKTWLYPENTHLNSTCRAYYDVTPMILAEELIEQINGEVYDYKFFCFSGNPVCFRIDYNRAVEHKANWYDLDKNLLPWGAGTFSCDPEFKPVFPEKLDEMIEIAKKLSKEFPFVRVDFYYIDDKIMLSEMTFYPGSGYSNYPLDVDREWGRLFELPEKTPLGRKHRRDLGIWY